MMKKAISLLLVLVLCLSLCACGASTEDPTESIHNSSADTLPEELSQYFGEWTWEENIYPNNYVNHTVIIEASGVGSVHGVKGIWRYEQSTGLTFYVASAEGEEVSVAFFDFIESAQDGNIYLYGNIFAEDALRYGIEDFGEETVKGELYKDGPEYRYNCAVYKLHQLIADAQTPISLTQEDAQSLIDEFTALGDYKDSAEILSRFVVLPQMYTGATLLQIDNLGNEFEKDFASYTYDASGKMASAFEYYQGLYLDTDHMETYGQLSGVGGGFYFQYDDNGIITGVQYGNISALFTPSYDADGKLTSILAKYNEGTYEHTFAYNDAGLRTSATIPVLGGTYIYKYIYNDEGVLVQKEIESKNTYDSLVMSVIITYEYDVNNNILQTTTSATRYNQYYGTETHVYIYDDQGRRISAEINTDEPGVIFASQTVTYHYEDIYFYNPSN